jgi:Hint domain
VTFSGTGGLLQFDQNLGNAGTVTGFSAGDTLLFSGLTYASSITATLAAGNILNLIEGGTTVATTDLNVGTSFHGDTFHVVSAASGAQTAVTLTVACFAEGTRIDTYLGERAVETLRAGDQVPTVLGGGGTVVWVGHRRIDCDRHPDPEAVMPVRIAKDAFAPGVPRRDLFLSPDHAVYLSGVLVPIRLLINGSTIRRESRPSVVYYHVELRHHDVLLAEGLPAESYLDTGNRGMFANGGAVRTAHANFDAAPAVRETGSRAPFVSRPEDVEPLWRSLADRALALGFPPLSLQTFSDDPDLHILIGGRRLNPIQRVNGRYDFALPRGGAAPVLRSRTGRPSASRPWFDDRRDLGVRIKCITLRSCDGPVALPLDHEMLTDGWWNVETVAGTPCRWTAGAARLPRLPSGILEVTVDGVVPYPVASSAEPRRQQAA